MRENFNQLYRETLKSHLLRLGWFSHINCLLNHAWNLLGHILSRRLFFFRLVKRVVGRLARYFLQCFPLVTPEMRQLQHSVFPAILIRYIRTNPGSQLGFLLSVCSAPWKSIFQNRTYPMMWHDSENGFSELPAFKL